MTLTVRRENTAETKGKTTAKVRTDSSNPRSGRAGVRAGHLDASTLRGLPRVSRLDGLGTPDAGQHLTLTLD